MKTVKDFLGLRKTVGDVGVEIEVEGKRLPHPTGKFWRRDNDPSLRGEDNGEYVMVKPVAIDQLTEAFEELDQEFKRTKAKVDNNYRAGVHVHVNVQDLTGVELFNFITLFLIFEEPLVDFCAPSRRGNHFCLRAKDAGYLTEMLWQAASTGRIEDLSTDDIRYSAMNLSSLFKYGSVEFRSLESTIDFDRLSVWCNLLHRLKVASKMFKDPKEIMGQISVGGYDHFTAKVFGGFVGVVLESQDWRRKVREGILHSQDMAFSRNWGKISLDIFKKDNGFL